MTEIDAALEADILIFNVESEAELELLAERAALLGKRARFALRVNPDVFAEDASIYFDGVERAQVRDCDWAGPGDLPQGGAEEITGGGGGQRSYWVADSFRGAVSGGAGAGDGADRRIEAGRA